MNRAERRRTDKRRSERPKSVRINKGYYPDVCSSRNAKYSKSFCKYDYTDWN